MKILVVSNMYPSRTSPSYGTFVATFVSQLKELNGGRVHLSVIRGRSKHKLFELLKYMYFYIHTFILALCGKYDIIYVHTITFPIIPLRLASLFRELPLVFNVHGGDVLVEKGLAAKLKDLSTNLVKKALLIVAPSAYFKNVVKKSFDGINDQKIFVSPSGGVDACFFSAPVPTTADIPTIGYLSRIGEGKGWDTFLYALGMLKEEGVSYRAIIAGRGPQKQDLLKLLSANHLEDRVEFKDLEIVKHEDLPKVYRCMDVFVFSSKLAESLGLVGLEAMATGMPVIGSNTGAILSYLQDGYNGLVFEAGNATDLKDKIMLYLSLSDDQKMQMAQHAFQTAQNYESTNIAQLLYNKLLSLLK